LSLLHLAPNRTNSNLKDLFRPNAHAPETAYQSTTYIKPGSIDQNASQHMLHSMTNIQSNICPSPPPLPPRLPPCHLQQLLPQVPPQ